MKKILLLFPCLIMLSTLVYSQKMVEENKAWNIFQGTFGVGLNAYTLIYKFQDTVESNNQVYHKLWVTTDSTLQNFTETGQVFREDSLGRVYLKYVNSTFDNEYLAYDFSLMVGDTFSTDLHQSYVVHDIDSISLENGTERKRMSMRLINVNSTIEEPWLVSWIEGIGSERGTFDAFYAFVLDAFEELLCHHENENLIYQAPSLVLPNQDVDCYRIVVDIDNISKNKPIIIHPNPANNWLNIKGLEQVSSTCQLEIFNLAGQQVFKQSLQNIINQELSFNLTNGLYFYKISTENTLLKIGKLMVQD